MSSLSISRRRLVSAGSGFAAGIFLTSRGAGMAQDATPAPETHALGFVSMRVRTVAETSQRERVDELVLSEFVPEVEALDGFKGFILGDVVDAPEKSLSIVVLEQEGQAAAFDEAAKEFVERIGDEVVPVETVQWTGDLLIAGAPTHDGATPVATSVGSGEALRSGYAAVRVHTSLPGTDPHEFVPLATEEFLPIIAGLDGFLGYLWFPTEDGFAAISLYDSEVSAEASTEAARVWAVENLADYTDGNPEVINANVVYANLPILR